MRAADYIVDIGPGAGAHGGEMVAAGTPEEIMAEPRSVTGQYLSGRRAIRVPAARRQRNGKWLEVRGRPREQPEKHRRRDSPGRVRRA